MPTPNPSTMGGYAPGRPRAFSAAMQDALARIPTVYPGEGMTADGHIAFEETSALGRSPGCFAVSVRGDRKAIKIGESWMGLGESEDEGGLEGCSARRPGLVLSSHGDVCIVGGSVEKTTAALVSEAGGSGITIVLACVPQAYSTETDILFKGWHVASTIDTAIGRWENVRRSLATVVQDDYEVIPIALLDIDEDDGDYLVNDVFWNLEAPVVTLPPSLRHPWRTYMKYNGLFNVDGGRVDDGTTLHEVTGLTDVNPATSNKVWLTLASGTVTLNHGMAWPTTGTTMRVSEITAKHEVRQYLYEDQVMRGGGESAVLLRITGLHPDSPLTGIQVYQGNIHREGSGSAATQVGVTVRIPDIAPNVFYPSSGAWSSLPPCLGFSTVQTWTGKTVTHTNDVVYEALGLILMW